MPSRPMPRLIAVAATLAAMQVGGAFAQSAPAPDAAGDGLKLDQIVITGTATRTSKMKQSVSVSTLSSEQIERVQATSAADLLRSIPGVRSESSGGEGNANINVRGVPLSAGGARYVQLQEDGLPVLLFGDIAFGTADQFLRADYSIDRLEVIRGGSASTLATNSPGGIVNFISKTGAETGGAAGLTAGLDRRQFRLDANYGGKIGPSTTFHIGGFQRVGDGGRPTGFNAENGGQIRGNITQKLDGGFVRVSFKSLDDRTPTFLPVPVRTVNGEIQQIAGIDPRKAFFITPSIARDTTLNRDGSFTTSDTRDGLRVSSTAFGVEAQFDLGNGFSFENRFRKTANSGRFMGLFPSDNGGATNFFTGVLFNTSIDDLGNTFNDSKVSKVFDLGGGSKATVAGGLFFGVQDVALTWFWNRYRFPLVGNGAQTVSATGAPSSAPIGDGFTTFGGCCARQFDVQYTQAAPYASVAWESGPINVDASVRYDKQKASGYSVQGSGALRGWDPATQKTINYTVDHTSFSFGGNYSFDRNLAAFARISDGVSFSADRLLYGNPLDGSTPISINKVQQFEGGVKWRQGGLSAFVTAFNAKTDESNYEVTTQRSVSNKYDSKGVELEGAASFGDFRLIGGMTLTNAKITASTDATTIGKKPRRQADVVWQLAPVYSFGNYEVGASLVGTSKSFGDDGNTITLPAYTTVNAFGSVQLGTKATVSLGVNNLFNTLAYTEVEGDGHAARALNGRTVKATLKYAF